MKKIILITLLMSTSTIFAATKTNVVVKSDGVEEKVRKVSYLESFSEKLSINPYYSIVGNNKFDEAGIGTEVQFHINKYIAPAIFVEGFNNTHGSFIDHVGIGLTTRLPVGRNGFSFYGQGAFGYFTETTDTDMILRGGMEFKFNKHIGIFGDFGQGINLQNANTYQQIRSGINLSF